MVSVMKLVQPEPHIYFVWPNIFQHIGCDYMIDSKAIEDRCGICHGDGSTCTTVKSKYTETQGLGNYFLYYINSLHAGYFFFCFFVFC